MSPDLLFINTELAVLACILLDSELVHIQDIALTAAMPGTYEHGIKLLISIVETLSPVTVNVNL